MTHDDDKSLTEALQTAREAGRRCALATIVGTKGSTPRKVGARMIVDPEVGLSINRHPLVRFRRRLRRCCS